MVTSGAHLVIQVQKGQQHGAPGRYMHPSQSWLGGV